MARTVMLISRAMRFRCPHCGTGRILGARFAIRERCSTCGLRFERSDDDYFAAATFCNLFIAEGLFFVGFLTALVVLWPNVPWDALTYVSVSAMIIFPIVLYPFSKALWLCMDVLLRPVVADELREPDNIR